MKISRCTKSSSGILLTRWTISPSRIKLMSLYLKAVPGCDCNFSAQAFLIAVVLAVPVGFGFDVRRQAGSVRHQFAHGDQFLAIAGEFGNVSLHRRIQISSARARTSSMTAGVVATTLVSEAASKIVSSVIGSRVRHQRAIAVCLVIRRAVVFQPQHAAGTFVVRDGFVDGRVHRRQFVRAKHSAKSCVEKPSRNSSKPELTDVVALRQRLPAQRAPNVEIARPAGPCAASTRRYSSQRDESTSWQAASIVVRMKCFYG